MRPTVRLTIAAATTAVVAVGLATSPSTAASPVNRAHSVGQSPGLVRSELMKRAKDVSLPAGIPRHGSFGFLLRLSTRSTTAAASSARSPRAARTAARAQLRAIGAAQSRVIGRLPAGTSVLYRTHALMSGVAVYTDTQNYARLRAIPGVSAIYPIATKYRANSYAVPFQHAPQAWTAYGDRGKGATIAVIDTGVDYTHADFGGPGTVAAYNAAKAHDARPAARNSYDHAKFDATTKDVHGRPAYFYDFAGDPYYPGLKGHSVPHPDPNPLDCGVHGTHVAGTAAGYGVNHDGTTYTGSYNTATPFDSMRIGPGMAPLARLAVYKVFGCHGGTNIAGEAIDRAMDPNGDGSTRDHVSVINMSLGLDYGSADDGDSVLSNLASQAGVTVVAAAGNGGDLYDVGGSPADATRVIAVANSVDAADLVDALKVSGPSAIAGRYAAERSIAYPWKKKHDLTGTVVALSEAGNKDGCDPLDAADRKRVVGKVVFEEWTDNDNVRRCGSVQRGFNLEDAHAAGFIFGDDRNPFTAGITGSEQIPGVLLAKNGADTIRKQLAANTTVTISGTKVNGFYQLAPEGNDTLDIGSSRGIRTAGDVKPDVTAVGETVFSAGMGTGNRGKLLTGTSMATPMVAGAAALIRAKHGGWTPEQVKADIMNTADHDLFTGFNDTGAKYGPNRVGAGRLDVKSALDNSVLAYTVDGSHGRSRGNVSASFGAPAIRVGSGLHRYRKTIRLQNTGARAASYTVSYAARTTIRGVSYSMRPSQLTVPAHSTRSVTLTLTVRPRQMAKTIDPTVSRTDGGIPRQYLADASGLVMFTGTNGVPGLRVPAYAAPRPASNMHEPNKVVLSRGKIQSAFLPLHGVEVDQGSGPRTVRSIVAGFELQGISGSVPHCSAKVQKRCVDFPDERSADIKYVATTSDAPEMRRLGSSAYWNGVEYFSVTTQRPWRTPVGQQAFEVFIDGNGDHRADSVLVMDRLPGLALPDSDIMVSELFDLKTGELLDLEPINDVTGDVDTAVFDSNTVVLPVWIPVIPGVTRARSRINYVVVSQDEYHSRPVDSVGEINLSTLKMRKYLSTNVLYPGVSVFGSYTGHGSPLLYADSPGAVLQVRRDKRAYANDHGRGALIVHFQNQNANKAQRVALATR